MKSIAAVLSMAAAAHGLTEEYVRANSAQLWATFKETHGKAYATAEEEQARMAVFHGNMLKAAGWERHQTQGAQFGLSPFADLSAEEFKSWHNATSQPDVVAAPLMFTETQRLQVSSVTTIDWRSLGAVTAVKNQQACGSCWAFSTTGGIEGQNYLHGSKQLVSLSEQQFVSCDKHNGNMGCQGGLQNGAYKYLLSERNGEVVSESAYPYTAVLPFDFSKCKDLTNMEVGATIKGWKQLPADETQMETFVATMGPLSVTVDATIWQMYFGGIIDMCTPLWPAHNDHAVLIVGYGYVDGCRYWTIKNSWGAGWGEHGYIRVARGSNQCGINRNAVTATF